MTGNPHLSRSLLANPQELRLEPPDSVTRLGPTLIVAPHPDDETLGCGGLIALLVRSGVPVTIVLVTNGNRSHPGSRSHPPEELGRLRRSETLRACEILGLSADKIVFLGIGDGIIPRPDQEEFPAARARLVEVLKRHQPQSVFTPWRRDMHHDHIATTRILRAALVEWGEPCRVLEYPIWIWEADRHDQTPTAGEVSAWRLDVSEVLGLKREAIAEHRSQTTRLIEDDPEGFMLSPPQIERFLTGWEVYFEEAEPAENKTLSPAYFEGMYAQDEDPWEFATSAYEAEKYKHTVAVLPKDSYQRVLEIGCSIGVLSAMLAERCRFLLAVEASEKALETARSRCAHLKNIEFQRAFVPVDWPPGEFDLIVMSEVAYYLGTEDLTRLFEQVEQSLPPGGHWLLVHWTPLVSSYPQTGDGVHELAMSRLGWRSLVSERRDTYRLDLLKRE